MRNFCQSNFQTFVANFSFSLIAFETFFWSLMFCNFIVMCRGVDLSLSCWILKRQFWFEDSYLQLLKIPSCYFFSYFFSVILSILLFRNSCKIKLALLTYLLRLLVLLISPSCCWRQLSLGEDNYSLFSSPFFLPATWKGKPEVESHCTVEGHFPQVSYLPPLFIFLQFGKGDSKTFENFSSLPFPCFHLSYKRYV